MAFAVGLTAVVLAVSQVVGGDGDATVCDSAPRGDSSMLIFRLRPRGGAVSADTRDETLDTLCRRLQALGVPALVEAAGGDRIRVVRPDDASGDMQRAIDLVGVTAQLYFYDWQANLIGRERTIGGFPGRQPPEEALRVYSAVRLASEQQPRPDCGRCSTDKPRHYLFSRGEDHRLLAGPVFSRKDLLIEAGRSSRDVIVETVPPGTVVVAELPSGPSGAVLEDAEPGWYALHDNPALSGADIVEPEEEADAVGRPSVVFEFTDEGRQAFHDLTRQVARRGQASSIGPVSGGEAEQLSHHFAIVFDNEVMTRPIINFAESPDGIDGRDGAQISGGFATVEEAEALAAFLRIGPLPADLVLVDRRGPAPSGSGG